VKVPDQEIMSIASNEWIFISSIHNTVTFKFEGNTNLHWIQCDLSLWTALQQDHEPDSEQYSRQSCITCAKRNETLLFKGIQTAKMQFQLSELSRLKGETSIERLKVASLSYELLSCTLECSEFSKKPKSDPCFKGHDLDALEATARFLESNLDADHSIQKLSRQFFLNEFKLKKGFKARYQTTVFGYLRQKRMEFAKVLLLEGNISVLEIATRVGYSNPSHFTRAFRETFGINPRDLKRN